MFKWHELKKKKSRGVTAFRIEEILSSNLQICEVWLIIIQGSLPCHLDDLGWCMQRVISIWIDSYGEQHKPLDCDISHYFRYHQSDEEIDCYLVMHDDFIAARP